MKKVIIWYGSLLSSEGWNKTLSRKVNDSDMMYIELKWYKRLWSCTNPLKFENDENIYWWVFLDIIEDENSILNAFWVEVSDEEFNLISIREKPYKMEDVTNYVLNKKEWYVYYISYLIDKNQSYWVENVIPKKYYDFVENILDKLWEDFRKQYNKSTIKPSYNLKEGEYKFLDPEINKLTWHK